MISYFCHDRGTYYEFTFDPAQAGAAPERIETAYAPKYIPDGYAVSYEAFSTAAVSIRWKSETGSWIRLLQVPMPDDPGGALGGINAEGVTVRYEVWNGYEVFCVDDEGANIYAWTNHAYMFTLICEDAVSVEETRKIFGSIQPVEDAVIRGVK